MSSVHALMASHTFPHLEIVSAGTGKCRLILQTNSTHTVVLLSIELLLSTEAFLQMRSKDMGFNVFSIVQDGVIERRSCILVLPQA